MTTFIMWTRVGVIIGRSFTPVAREHVKELQTLLLKFCCSVDEAVFKVMENVLTKISPYFRDYE